MRLAKLCITLALAICGWHDALASALCARHADCHASASDAPGRRASRETQNHANSSDDEHVNATPAAVDHTNDHTNDLTNDLTSHQDHCGSSAESPRKVVHAAPPDAETETARGGEKVSPESAVALRAPGSSCEHCVVRQTDQPARLDSVAPAFARDSHASPAPTQHLAALTPLRPRPSFAPAEHSPPRGRPLHLLNSALLI